MLDLHCKPHAMGLSIPHNMGFVMTDPEFALGDAFEAFRIWDEPQFTVQDVCTLTGATPKAIEHFVDPARNMVRLLTPEATPGKGRRRLFTGGQVLMIKTAYLAGAIGFPQKFSATMAEQVLRRATGLPGGSDMHLISYPLPNGDWAAVPIYKETHPEPKLPVAFQIMDVDRLVTETRAQLEAIIAGQDVPDFAVPDIPPEPNPFSPRSNAMGEWEKDDQGRWRYIGLSYDETAELLNLTGWRLDGDDLIDDDHHKVPREHRDRYLELYGRKKTRGT